MRPLHLLVPILLLTLAACGGGSTPSPGDPAAREEAARAEAGEGVRDSYDTVRQMQQQALEETADLVAAAADASPEELEEAMATLNRALLRGRSELAALRGMEDDETRRPLMRELRQANNRLREAYDALMAHHPDPGSVQLEMDPAPAS